MTTPIRPDAEVLSVIAAALDAAMTAHEFGDGEPPAGPMPYAVGYPVAPSIEVEGPQADPTALRWIGYQITGAGATRREAQHVADVALDLLLDDAGTLPLAGDGWEIIDRAHTLSTAGHSDDGLGIHNHVHRVALFLSYVPKP